MTIIRARRSIRLPGYDYTQPGAYFVTLVVQGRENCFGEVVSGKMILNEMGRIAVEEWFHTAQLRLYVRLEPDEMVVMPNHVHAIIWILDDSSFVGAQRAAPLPDVSRSNAPLPDVPRPPRVVPASLGAIVRSYKSAVSRRVNPLMDAGSPLWQRNYYEHILRSDADLDRVRSYIRSNPLLWEQDRENLIFLK